MKLILAFALAVVLATAETRANPALVVGPMSDYDINARNDELLRYIWALRYAQLLGYYNNRPIENRFGDDNLQGPAVAAKPQCKQIGEPCVYHSDCCSNACPSYWGKCVS